MVNDSQIKEVLNYLTKVPTPDYFNSMKDDDKQKMVFNAAEEVSDVLLKYPNIKLSTRMIALQTLYNAEGEEEGIAMMRRQGITDYTVKDVKAVLDKETISPGVFAIIDALDVEQPTTMRVGRLI